MTKVLRCHMCDLCLNQTACLFLQSQVRCCFTWKSTDKGAHKSTVFSSQRHGEIGITSTSDKSDALLQVLGQNCSFSLLAGHSVSYRDNLQMEVILLKERVDNICMSWPKCLLLLVAFKTGCLKIISKNKLMWTQTFISLLLTGRILSYLFQLVKSLKLL